jgi:hypothetical protein
MSRKEPLLHMHKLMHEQKHGKNVDWKINWLNAPIISVETMEEKKLTVGIYIVCSIDQCVFNKCVFNKLSIA